MDTYNTSDLWIAAFLVCKGKRVIGLNKTNPQRILFEFELDEEIPQLVQKYNFAPENDSEMLIDIRSFYSNQKKIKSLLFDVSNI